MEVVMREKAFRWIIAGSPITRSGNTMRKVARHLQHSDAAVTERMYLSRRAGA